MYQFDYDLGFYKVILHKCKTCGAWDTKDQFVEEHLLIHADLEIDYYRKVYMCLVCDEKQKLKLFKRIK